jgi:hypothetical protein
MSSSLYATLVVTSCRVSGPEWCGAQAIHQQGDPAREGALSGDGEPCNLNMSLQSVTWLLYSSFVNPPPIAPLRDNLKHTPEVLAMHQLVPWSSFVEGIIAPCSCVG